MVLSLNSFQVLLENVVEFTLLNFAQSSVDTDKSELY